MSIDKIFIILFIKQYYLPPTKYWIKQIAVQISRIYPFFLFKNSVSLVQSPLKYFSKLVVQKNLNIYKKMKNGVKTGEENYWKEKVIGACCPRALPNRSCSPLVLRRIFSTTPFRNSNMIVDCLLSILSNNISVDSGITVCLTTSWLESYKATLRFFQILNEEIKCIFCL